MPQKPEGADVKTVLEEVPAEAEAEVQDKGPEGESVLLQAGPDAAAGLRERGDKISGGMNDSFSCHCFFYMSKACCRKLPVC